MKVEGGGHYLRAVNDGARTVGKSPEEKKFEIVHRGFRSTS